RPGTPPRELVDHRQGERRSLARACLGNAQNVPSRQNMRNGLSLNRRGRGIAGFANSLKNLRREAEFVKCHIKGPVHLDFTARLGPPSGPWTNLSLRSRQGRAVLRVL